MGYAMKGAPTHYGTSKHKSALKQVSDSKNKGKYAKIIKDHNMTKDEKGHWRDKDGRTPNSISQGIKHGQRSYKLPASGSTKNNDSTNKNKNKNKKDGI